MSRTKAAIQYYLSYDDRDQKRDERDGQRAFVKGVDLSSANELLRDGQRSSVDAAKAHWQQYLSLLNEEKGRISQSLQDHDHQLSVVR